MTANVTPTPAEMLAALQSPYYGMVFLGLATQAYTAEGSPRQQIQKDLYSALTQTSYTPQVPGLGQEGASQPVPMPGSWSLDWGPAGTADNSNLLYIASYRAQGNPHYADGTPYFFAVAIRGTDTSVGILPLWQQIGEDIGDFRLWSWADLLSGADGDLSVPTPNTTDVSSLSGNVAHGSLVGFVKLANSGAPLNNGKPPAQATGTAVTVVAALNDLLSQCPGTPVVVTGHSLGGCQTQLMAAYLGWQLGAGTSCPVPVIPQAFAPPTAGDQGFVDTYQALCPSGFFWYNTYDLIPYAYTTMTVDGKPERGLVYADQNLWKAYPWPAGSQSPTGKDLSGQPGPPLPWFLSDLIKTLDRLIPTVYQRPSIGLMPLNGSMPQPQAIEVFLQGMDGGTRKGPDPTGSDAQLLWQHFPPCYSDLMWQQYQGSFPRYMVTPYKPHSTR